MGDEQVSQAELLPQVQQQVEHLGLDGNVQSGDGLIADHEVRSKIRAMAMATRWRWPPESSLGQRVR